MTLEDAEESAYQFASDMAGEYLATLPHTDLAKFTPEQWRTLLEIIALNFRTKSIELQTVPF